MVVGAGTALADRPTLTFRNLDFGEGLTPPQPLRVLLDAAGRVPATGPLFDTALAPTLVITTPAADPRPGEPGKRPAPKWRTSPPPPGRSAPCRRRAPRRPSALELLGRRGVLQAMVEGGATLHGSFLRAGLADRLVVYAGGAMLGAEGRPLAAGPGPATLAEAVPLAARGRSSWSARTPASTGSPFTHETD